MKRRIACSVIYFIIWLIVSSIVGILMGNSDWLLAAIIGSIGAAFGVFGGYAWGQSDQGKR